MSVFDIYSTYLTDEGYVSENSFFDPESLYHYKFVIHDHYITRTVTSYTSAYGAYPMVVNAHGYLNAPLMYKTNVVDPIYYDTEINENLTSTLNITKDGSITVTALDTYDENLSDYENLDNVEVTINGGKFNSTIAQRYYYTVPFANSSPKTITYKLKVNTYGRRGNVSNDTYLTPPYASLTPFISYKNSSYTYSHKIYIVKLDNGKSLICADIFINSKRNIADNGSAVSTTDITIVTSNELNIDWSVYHDIKLEYFFKKHPSYNYECTYIKLSIDNTFIPFHSLMDSGNLSIPNLNTYYCDTDENSEYYGYLTIVTRMDNSGGEMFYYQNNCDSSFVNIGSYDNFNTDAKNTKWNVSIKKLEISDIDLPTTWKFYSTEAQKTDLDQEGYDKFLYYTVTGNNPNHIITAENNYGYKRYCYYACTPKGFTLSAHYNEYPNQTNTTYTLITSDREFRLNESNTYFSLEKVETYIENTARYCQLLPFETDNRTYFISSHSSVSEHTITRNDWPTGGIFSGKNVDTLENTEDVTYENGWCKLNGTTKRGLFVVNMRSTGVYPDTGIQYELFFKLTHEDIVNIKNNLSSPDGHVILLCGETNIGYSSNYIALLYKPNLIVGNEDTLGRNILGDEIDGWFEVCRYNGTYSLETYALYPKLKSQDVYHLCYILRNIGSGHTYNIFSYIILNGIYLFIGEYVKIGRHWFTRKMSLFTNDTSSSENKIWCSFRSVKYTNEQVYPVNLNMDAICNIHLDTEMPTEGTESFYRTFIDNRYKHINIEALYPDNKITLPTYVYYDWMRLESTAKLEWIETVNDVSRVVSTADEYEVPLNRSKVITLSCTNAYAVNKKLNITITMLIPPTAIIKPITDLTYIEYGQYIELDGSDSYDNITRYQWSSGELTDRIGFYVYGDTSKTLTVYNAYGSDTTTITIRGVLMSQTLISLNNLTRYSNNLKPKTVTDLTINSNKITVKYLDNHTKQLTLPSGGSATHQTRTVTRVPTYMELHVNIGSGNVYYDSPEDDDNYFKPSSKLDINPEDLKKIFTFEVKGDYDSKGFAEIESIIVTDVTSTKARNANDSVFLFAINLVCPFVYTSFVNFNIKCAQKSFGNMIIRDPLILTAVNSILDEPVSYVSSQIYSDDSLTTGYDCSYTGSYNYLIVDARISTDDLSDTSLTSSDGNVSVYNNYFVYAKNINESYCKFTLKLSDMKLDTTPVTFTEVIG